MISAAILGILAMITVLPIFGMVKNKNVIHTTKTDYNVDMTTYQPLTLIGDIQGFDVSVRCTATFSSGSGNIDALFDRAQVITDGSEILHDLKNFQNQGYLAALTMFNRINTPTDEALATTVEKYLHFSLPFPIIRALVQSAELRLDWNAGTDVIAGISAMSTQFDVSARYGPVNEQVRWVSVLRSDALANYSVEVPTDKGNLTGFFLVSTDADLISPNTYVHFEDENGLPVTDTWYASEIIAQNEQYMQKGWKGAFGSLYVLYVDVPLVACKPDLRLKVNCNGALTNGLQVYYLHSYATQQLVRPDRVSPKMLEIGAYAPDDVEIRVFRSLTEQANRCNMPIIANANTGMKVDRVEKTIQK